MAASERQSVLRAAARKNLIDYCEVVDRKYRAEPFHEYLAERLQAGFERMMAGHNVRIIIEEPPRHGKSELATIRFPSWVLGAHPEIPILECSYNDTIAQKFGLKTRDLVQSDRYKKIFTTTIRADQKAKGSWLTPEGGGFTSTGIHGSITGSGFKIGIIDDPFKERKEADSITYREDVWDFYRSTFYTRQEGNTMIVIICTRWHKDDLIGRLEEQESLHLAGGDADFADEWEYITFPAIATQNEEFEVNGKTYRRKKGEALWPAKFPIGKLKTIQNQLGPYEFSALYQQTPIPSEKQEFKDKWFQAWDPDDMDLMMKSHRLDYFTLCDPNASEEAADANDEWVVVTIAKERNSPNIYRIEESAGRGDTAQMLKAIFRHVETYQAKFGIETVNAKALMYAVKEEQKRRESFFTIYEMQKNRRIPKEIRVRAMIPRYAAKVIWHMPDDAVYESQLKDFPKGKHDDRIDAMANFVEMLEQFGLTDYDDDGTGQDFSARKSRNLDPYPQNNGGIFQEG